MMKTLKSWLLEYGEGHRHPVNKMLHWICVPSIVFSLLCALKAIPLGDALVNAATLLLLGWILYYASLCWQLALGMVIVFCAMYAGVLLLETALGPQLPWLAATVFVLAWVGRFVGHEFEGARPSFLKDLQFLLIGPIWLLADFYRRVQIPMGAGAGAMPLPH
ncbi:MAG TPA: Mpo1-like protein [Solimonas sp.]|nr:Mpo1-like protein [Solimonas sp.]